MQTQPALPVPAATPLIAAAPAPVEAAADVAVAADSTLAPFQQVLAAQVQALALAGETLLERTGPDTELGLSDAAAELLAQLAAEISGPIQPIALNQFLAQAATTFDLDAGEGATVAFDPENSASSWHQNHTRAAEPTNAQDEALAFTAPAGLPTDLAAARRAPAKAEAEALQAVSTAETAHNMGEAHGAVSTGRAADVLPINPRHIPEPVRSPAFSESLGQRVLWMARENVQVVHLQVEPPNLGPLEVQLSLKHDQANVVFVSAHAAVRDAISQSLSTLDELLAAGGVSLGSVSVSTQDRTGEQRGDAQGAWQGVQKDAFEPAPESNVASKSGRRSVGVGLVDTFA